MAALVGVISKVFASGFLKSVLGRILISVALGAVQTLLAKARADRIAAANRGIRGEKTLSGSKNPMGFILGRYATGGVHVVTPYTSGTNNNYMTYVIMLGCRRGATLTKMIVSGEVVELDTTTHATYGRNVLGKYAGKMWVKFRNGTETTADTFLTSTFGSHPDRPWTSDMIGRDAPHAIVTFFYDDELYNQYPEVRFEVSDTPLYDIRKDTTAGGSGAHRWSDPTTWEPTTNPVVMIYNILRGIPIAGVGTWGGEAEAEDFRFTEWAAAMNKAQSRYQAGFEVYLSDKPDAVISELLKACSGQIADVGGTWRVSVGAPDAAVYYFSDEDLIVSENTQFDPFPGVEDTTNTVVATFVNPEALWEVSEAITTTNADFIATDDARILETDLSLSAVFDSVQAQDLATTMLADNRRFRSHITTLPLSAMFVEPLDTVGWTSEYNGYNAKLFEIGQCSADVIGCIPTVTSRERDPNDYDFAGGVPYVPVSTVTTPIPTVVDGFTVTGHIITDGSSNRRPALRITWGAGSMGFARSIRYRVRLTASPTTMTNEGAHADPSSGVLIISEGILPAVSYQVSVKVVARGRSNPWSSWITVVSPDVRFSAEDFDLTTTPATPTGLSLSSALTATGGVRLTATWTAVAGTDIRYDIRLRQNGGNDVVFSTSTNRYEWDVLPNTNYVAAVRAVGRLLVTSVYSAEVSHTTTKDSVAPAVPTGLAVTGGFETLWLKWNDVSDSDLDFYEVFESATSTPAPTAGSTPTYTTAANTLVLTGLADGVTKHFWVRSVDTSNNKSAWTARAQGTTVALVAADVSGILQEASYSVNLVPPVVVATLPTTGNFQGRLALLTTDNKLYRYTGSAWTTAVPAVDITGQVTGTQIADAAITTAKFASGIEPVEIVATLPTTGNFQGRIALLTTDNKLYRYTGSAWTAAVPAVDITGQITGTQIADAAITTAKFASGIEPVEIVATLPTTGNFAGRIAFLTTDNKLYRHTGTAWTTAVPAVDVTGQITGTQISDNAISTPKIAANAVEADKIAANAITAGKIAADAVTAGTIAAGAVNAREIAANAITTGQMAVRSFNNLIENPDFENGALHWTNPTRIVNDPANALRGSWVYTYVSTSSANAFVSRSNLVEALPGDSFYVRGSLKNSAGSTGDFYLQARFYDAAGATINTINMTWSGENTSWSERERIVTAPANTVSMAVVLYTAGVGTVYWDGISLMKAAEGKLIVDGAIEADKIAANAVTAGKIAANAVTATAIAADAVTAGKVATGAITAREIAAGAITADKIVVSDFENLAGDANFDDTSFWTKPATTTFIAATAGFTSRNVMQLSGASNAFVVPNGMTFQVKAGDKLFLSLEGQITGGSGSCYAQVQFSASTDFSSPQYLSPPTITSTSVTSVSGELTVPAGMRYARIRLVKGSDGVTQCRFGNIIMRRMSGGELIVDGSIIAAKIAAGAVIAEKLSVLAANLVNNPSRSKNLNGWGGVTETGVGGDAAQTYDAVEDALTLTTVGGNYATLSNTFPIDHDKIYRISFKVKKSAAVGNIYVGVSGYTTWRLGSAGTASGAGTELFARHGADRVFISDTNNPYMLDTGSPSTSYLECVTYLIGANRSIADCPDHLGVANRPYIKASSTVRHVALRLLNWNNGTTTTTLFAKDISVSEVGTGQIVADNIKANAVTAGKIAADAVTAGTIAAGAITAREIAAQTIVASKMAVTDLTNLVLNNTLDTSEGWALEASVAVANAPAGMIRTRALEIGAVTVTRFARYTAAVDAGAEYVLSCQAAGTAGGKFTVRLGVIFRDAAGVQLTNPGATVATLTNATPVDVWDDFTAPAGAVTAEFRFGRTASGSEVGLGYIVNPTVRRKNGAELIVDGSITATKVGTNEIITTTANIKDATITDAKIVELSAAKLTAGTALAASITVNSKALSTIKTEAETGAQDPVTRINAGTTQIDPGKIVISGATTLADWRMGGDLTKINGGSISANTISANKLTIGSRGITTGIEFEHNSPAANSVSWTAGAVRYINDAGTSTTTNVTAGNAAWTSGVLYIYWVKGATTLSTTTSQATALGADNVILATYAGGTNLTGNYGRTIIDGSSIKTGTIDANRLTVTELSSITANVGILRTATSGERLEIRGDRILVYDASNVLRVRLGNLA